MTSRHFPMIPTALATLLLRLSAVAAQESSAKPPALVHVAGIVVNESTNVPVPRCHLTLRPGGARTDRRGGGFGSEQRTSDTDAQGRFAFDLPAEGTWQLSASATGYRTQLLNEHEGFSSAVVLHPGLAAPFLLFHLEPDSSLSGYVRDEAAEPVRNAALTLELSPTADGRPSVPRRQQRTITDDRGHFEIAGIPPGSYQLSVQATPWYATGAVGRSAGVDPAQARSDAMFDVVYPLTWYPGVFDQDTAGEISLRAGESQQLDFTLLPIPAAHLRITAPVANASQGPGPTIERVDRGQPSNISSSVALAAGQVDFGNLSPGLYRVTTPQQDGRLATTFVHVAAGASVALATSDPAGAAEVTFHIAGDAKSSRTQINLTDLSTNAVFTSGGFGLHRRFSPGIAASGDQAEADHNIAVPPGRYRVTLAGDPDLYLTSMTLQQKVVAGQVITLTGGPSELTINVARGRASVHGRTILAGKPVEGAMVMLVPSTFGQIGAIDLLRRDQSDTDGSFNLTEIVPGDYILFAIDRGWSVNWHNPATMNRYLLHGTPLSLQPHSSVSQEITAQSP